MNIRNLPIAVVLKKLLKKKQAIYNFDKSNPLGGKGERVDFTYSNRLDIKKLDMFQLNHYRRYEFACKIIEKTGTCGDFACGTGYGSVMLSKISKKVIGADINSGVIKVITKRYRHITNVEFLNANLLDITFNSIFDHIVSFETIEHFSEENIPVLLGIYSKSLKPGGKLIISTPYLQECNDAALKLGHHLTFYIDEAMINKWLTHAGFKPLLYKYQNYHTHIIEDALEKKDFIICVAQKISD